MLAVQSNANRLPLADSSVDLIVTSPPYFALRSYTDDGKHYAGQVGSESNPAEYIAALVECTREWMRVLKPSGSIFVNLGDKYSGAATPGGKSSSTLVGTTGHTRRVGGRRAPGRPKSLLLLPERYRIACVDQLGLIVRSVIIWSKPNGLPESVTDRVRRSHEEWVHLTKAPRYFAAVDEIRSPAVRDDRRATAASYAAGVMAGKSTGHTGLSDRANHPLGSLPGSVWEIASEPLKVPDRLGIDHFAAFPSEWPRRLILGWSPIAICTACEEGRRPVIDRRPELVRAPYNGQSGRRDAVEPEGNSRGFNDKAAGIFANRVTITGYACACTPYTDHPGTSGTAGETYGAAIAAGRYANVGEGWGGRGGLGDRPRVGRRIEYHFDQWTSPPTRPAVILDPFGGTGTTAHVASALGRIGISVDLSRSYCRLATAAELREKRRIKVQQRTVSN